MSLKSIVMAMSLGLGAMSLVAVPVVVNAAKKCDKSGKECKKGKNCKAENCKEEEPKEDAGDAEPEMVPFGF